MMVTSIGGSARFEASSITYTGHLDASSAGQRGKKLSSATTPVEIFKESLSACGPRYNFASSPSPTRKAPSATQFDPSEYPGGCRNVAASIARY